MACELDPSEWLFDTDEEEACWLKMAKIFEARKERLLKIARKRVGKKYHEQFDELIEALYSISNVEIVSVKHSRHGKIDRFTKWQYGPERSLSWTVVSDWQAGELWLPLGKGRCLWLCYSN